MYENLKLTVFNLKSHPQDTSFCICKYGKLLNPSGGDRHFGLGKQAAPKMFLDTPQTVLC